MLSQKPVSIPLVQQNPVATSRFFELMPFGSLPEKLSAIFSHPWQWILKATQQSEWTTETRYPIKPINLWHKWQSDTELVGVRFGPMTRYAMIDIDANSPYHLRIDPNAIAAIKAALDGIGLYRSLLLQSSESGGLHLYIPLPGIFPTYDVAHTIRSTLEEQFAIEAGTLEVFPNTKSYRVKDISSYNGHRLPLQQNSYLLDDDGNIITNEIEYFFHVWELAEYGNDAIEFNNAIARAKLIKRETLFQQSVEPKSERARKWKLDSERAIERGWTGYGQTNELIGTIAEYGVVFLALSGNELHQYVLRTAIAAPGYAQFCRHQKEIEQKCLLWAKSAERTRTPYKGESRGRYRKGNSNFNSDRAAGAVARIKQAVIDLGTQAQNAALTVKEWATEIAARAKCSISTLYKNKNLWRGEVCNDSNGPLEANSEALQPQPDVDQELLKPLPDGPLHTTAPMKVDRRRMGRYIRLSPDQYISKPSSDPPGGPFCDRGLNLHPPSGDRAPGLESLFLAPKGPISQDSG